MVGLGFTGALRGFERRVWSVTLYFFMFCSSFFCFPFFLFFFVLLDVLRY